MRKKILMLVGIVLISLSGIVLLVEVIVLDEKCKLQLKKIDFYKSTYHTMYRMITKDVVIVDSVMYKSRVDSIICNGNVLIKEMEAAGE